MSAAPARVDVLHMGPPRPRTNVTEIVPVTGRALVRFRVDAPTAASARRRRSLVADLEAYWDSVVFTGAALVYQHPAPKARTGVKVTEADLLLAFNVICRERAGLLLPGTPLDLDRLKAADLASDDHRLVALARGPR